MKKRVRAIIIKQGCLLLIKRTKNHEIYWVFPGGGVERSESEKDALLRECREELGIEIKIIKLFAKMPSQKPEIKGQEDFFYLSDIIGGILGNVDGPEYEPNSQYKGKYEITWVPLDQIANLNLKPEEIKTMVYRRLATNE